MRTIIAGSRDSDDPEQVTIAVRDCGWWPTVVISGHAKGVDRFGEAWAKKRSIPIELFMPNWHPNGGYDNGAGIKRNREMAQCADALIAIWDGESRGTKNMIETATKMGLRVYVHIYKPENLDDSNH